MVSHVGVDINMALMYPHYAHLLSFIGGLGLRKSHYLLQNIRNTKSMNNVVDSRKILLERKMLGGCVYNNAAGFIRISRETTMTDFAVDPLDNTRIHPECYNSNDFAIKICADALEVDAPPLYYEMVLKLMANSHNTLEKLLLIDPEAERNASEFNKDIKRHWLSLWNKGGRPADMWSSNNPSTYSNMNASNADQFYTELRDSLFDLVIENYAEEVLKSGYGRRHQQFNDIKEELRYPWLDIMRMHSPLRPPNADLLFELSTGGEKYENLYVGMKVSCTVQDVETYKAQLMVDNSIKGFVDIKNVSDERLDDVRSVLATGMLVSGVIIRINKERALVEVAMKSSLLSKSENEWMEERYSNEYVESWLRSSDSKFARFDKSFDERGALQRYAESECKRQKEIEEAQKSTSGLSTKNMSIGGSATDRIAIGVGAAAAGGRAGSVTRMVFHPLFSNCNYKEAEEKLRSRQVGDIIIRPSSKGESGLSITWAFQPGMYRHIAVEERGKLPGDTLLGKELCIEGVAEPFSDLDEIYSRYIMPMNEYVAAMVKHEKFREGDVEVIKQLLVEEKRQNPARTPYLIHCDARKCTFVLSWWMPESSTPLKGLTVLVTPDGYKMSVPGGKPRVMQRCSEVFNFMKEYQMQAHQARTQSSRAPAPLRPAAAIPMPPTYVPGSSNRDPNRRSKFDVSAPVPSALVNPNEPMQVEQLMPTNSRLNRLKPANRPAPIPTADDQWN